MNRLDGVTYRLSYHKWVVDASLKTNDGVIHVSRYFTKKSAAEECSAIYKAAPNVVTVFLNRINW